MRKCPNLTELKFGRLLVIKRVKKPENIKSQGSYWLCRCDCGNEKIIAGRSLKNKHTQSCGCYQKEKTSEIFLKDLTEKRFGKLIVKYDTGERQKQNGEIIWHCVCDCGNEVNVISGHLQTNNTQSCGCYQKEKASECIKDLSKQKFGKLTVDYDTKKRYRRMVIWHCTCDCGNEVEVLSDRLVRGVTKSCGCLSESLIAYELKKYFLKNYNAKTEYKILKNPNTGRWLSYDIYIPQGKNPIINGIYIEVNGKQHYNQNKFYLMRARKKGTTPIEEFEDQIQRDKLKKEFAKNNGTYIEININEIKTSQDAIDYLYKIIFVLIKLDIKILVL